MRVSWFSLGHRLPGGFYGRVGFGGFSHDSFGYGKPGVNAPPEQAGFGVLSFAFIALLCYTLIAAECTT